MYFPFKNIDANKIFRIKQVIGNGLKLIVLQISDQNYHNKYGQKTSIKKFFFAVGINPNGI